MNTILNLHKNDDKISSWKTFPLMAALHDYTASPLQRVQTTNNALHALEFEKKICRAGFKKSFGHHLRNPGVLEMSFGLYDVAPNVDSSRWKSSRNQKEFISQTPTLASLASFAFDQRAKVARRAKVGRAKGQTIKGLPLNTDLCFKEYNNRSNKGNKESFKVRETHAKRTNRSFMRSGIQLMSAYWVLERCIEKIRNKQSARGVLKELIRDVEVLLNYQHSACPVLGVRVTASGRLGKKKKGMAQKYTASTGKIPLGTFCQKVDYSQGFVSTKLGVIGLKVWVAFK